MSGHDVGGAAKLRFPADQATEWEYTLGQPFVFPRVMVLDAYEQPARATTTGWKIIAVLQPADTKYAILPPTPCSCMDREECMSILPRAQCVLLR